MTQKGLIHLYYGNGKGKTTAAMGLALRGYNAGKRVVVVQFLKDGHSGEIEVLRSLGIRIYGGKTTDRFVFQMNDEEKAETKRLQDENLLSAINEKADMLILDEACAALESKTVDEDLLKQAVLGKNESCEVILTGRNPAPWMVEKADYVTEMKLHKHPFEKGIAARKGVEF